MYSIKTKLFSLGLAAVMLLGLAGCNFKTPSDVGSIDGVTIPAGVYLLAQYNAYGTASGVAELATGETASDVKAVLKAECTGTIGDEEVTATGEEYIEKLTLRAVEYYAAVESRFDELGGTLSDEATAEAADTADSLWESNGELYEKNGIGQSSLETYLLNSQKAQALLELIYGEGGTEEVTEAEYADYIQNECMYLETVQLPLIDYTTYTMADDEQNEEIRAIAEACVEELNGTATAETASNTELYTAAMTYVPQVFTALGSELDATQAVYYAESQLYTPDDLSSYGESITAALDAVEDGTWTTAELGTGILVLRRIDPLATYTTEQLVSNYDLLTSMKSDELQDELYAAGAAAEHALDESAMKTYSPSNIKKS